MEFKKPTSYDEGRPRLNVPQRDGSLPTSATPSDQSPSLRAAIKVTAQSFVRHLPHSKKAILLTMGGIIVVVIGTSLLLQHRQAEINSKAKLPEFQTVLPGTKSISELGGWQRISPPEKDPVFAYADMIGDTPISISQQPLPASFRSDVNGQVAELAKKFNATTKIEAGDTKVYVGTSAKGPQSAILTKNGLLILIKSQSKIDDAAWAEYVKTLS
ncbi:MAG TPA: hypothetical protein VF281_04585 [Candidatus Saccharimonadales bacterium]